MSGVGRYTRHKYCPRHPWGRWLVSALQVIWLYHYIHRERAGNEDGNIRMARSGRVLQHIQSLPYSVGDREPGKGYQWENNQDKYGYVGCVDQTSEHRENG